MGGMVLETQKSEILEAFTDQYKYSIESSKKQTPTTVIGVSGMAKRYK